MEYMSSISRTRFAPSPTGLLHIGGARTALYSYLYAKHTGGEFYLRIEDSDSSRNSAENITEIINGLKWLGIDWDKDVYMQSNYLEYHQKMAQQLLDSGNAYFCWCQQHHNAENSNVIHKCDCLNNQNQSHDFSPAIRFKVDRNVSETILNDEILGKVTTQNKDIEDFIIMRGNNTPTYNFACCLDDINQKITHVIRGNDHLTNTFKQIQIYYALGIKVPVYVHLGLLHGEDGKKLSKRHGATSVTEYKQNGYLVEAVNNYLMLMGWSFNNQDIISMQEAIDNFSLSKLNKAPTIFSIDKLNSINKHYLSHSPDEDIASIALPILEKEFSEKYELSSSYKKQFNQALKFTKVRSVTVNDIIDNSMCFVITSLNKINVDELEKIKEYKDLITTQLSYIQNIEDFTRDNLQNTIKTHALDNNLKLGEAVKGIRLALCFQQNSPASVFDIMEIIGRKVSVQRIENLLQIL